MEQVVLYISLFLKLLPSLITAGEEVIPLIKRAYEIFTTGTPPTEADWAALREHEDAQTRIIQEPIPDE